MKKLLFLTTQDRFFLSHLKERALFAQANGFAIHIAAQKTSDNYVSDIEQMGFHFYDTKIERQSIGLLSQFKSLMILRKIYSKVKPDVAHHLGAKAIIYGTLVSLFTQGRNNYIVNAPIGLGYVYASKSLKAKLLKPLVTLLYCLTLNPKNSHVILENPDDLDYFVEIGALKRERASCIYGAGVDTEIYAPSSSKNEVFTVVMASRLIKEKGVCEFARAAEILKDNEVEVRMQLIGEPDYGNPNSLTREEYSHLRHSDTVECLGYRTDVVSFLKKAHVCCLPSYYREGLPRSLIEGVSCGLPIITTDTVGCRETVVNKNGCFVKCQDAEDLATKIIELKGSVSTWKEMSEQSRILALEKFDTKIICQETLKIYKDLLDI